MVLNETVGPAGRPGRPRPQVAQGGLGTRQKRGTPTLSCTTPSSPSTGSPRTGPFYSGKRKKHGINLQVIASRAADILWGCLGAARLGPREDQADLLRAAPLFLTRQFAKATHVFADSRSISRMEKAQWAQLWPRYRLSLVKDCLKWAVH